MTTTRIEAWELHEIQCVLCAEDLGWSTGYAEMWCDRCAKQLEDEEDL